MARIEWKQWNRWGTVVGVLLALGVLGSEVVGSAVAPHFGSAGKCDGIGFGCAPIKWGDTVATMGLLWLGLAGTAVAARVLGRWQWWVATAGTVATGIAVAAASNSFVLRYPIATVTESHGQAAAEAAIRALVTSNPPAPAFGPLVSSLSSAPVAASHAPTPAALVSALIRSPAEACRDIGGKPMGAFRLSWRAFANVTIPPGVAVAVPRYVPSGFASVQLPDGQADQVRRMGATLRSAGWTLQQQSYQPGWWSFDARLRGPRPRRLRDAPWDLDYTVRVSVEVLRGDAPGTDASVPLNVRIEAEVATPCLGPD